MVRDYSVAACAVYAEYFYELLQMIELYQQLKAKMVIQQICNYSMLDTWTSANKGIRLHENHSA